MKTSLKILSYLLVIGLVLASCGGPGRSGSAAADNVNYRETVEAIRALTGELSDQGDETEARRYLAKLKKILEPVSNGTSNNDLIIVPVNVRPVSYEYISQKVDYLGDISGDPSVTVYPKLTDLITVVNIENGDYVEKGDVLAEISNETVRASRAQAEAAYLSAKSQLANVRVEYERTKTLYEAEAISDSQWDQIVTQKDVAESGLKQAQAALDMANTQLNYTKITAPIAGYVSGVAYEPGDMASPQKPFATIHQLKTVETSINVTENDLGKIRTGQRAEIRVSTYPDEIFEGRIQNISPVINAVTRTARVEIISDNYDLKLKPGMFARVSVITDERNRALTVDKAATFKQTTLETSGDSFRDDRVVEKYSCFIVRDGVAVQQDLQIGIEAKTKYEVISGLNEGDQVVIMGQNNLEDSTLVNIVE